MQLEQWLADNWSALVVVAGGAVALWRITVLERRMDRYAKDGREDRRNLYNLVHGLNNKFGTLVGYLKGKGVINGFPQYNDPQNYDG